MARLSWGSGICPTVRRDETAHSRCALAGGGRRPSLVSGGRAERCGRRLPSDDAVAVDECTRWAVPVDRGHGDDGVGALGDGLGAGVPVEVGGGITGVDRVDAQRWQGGRVLRVSITSALLLEQYAGARTVDSTRSGSCVSACDPRPLATLTTTPLSDPRSSRRNAGRTRTGPKTFVSYTSRRSSAVTSPTSLRAPLIPALLMSTSRDPTVSTAAATEASSFTPS